MRDATLPPPVPDGLAAVDAVLIDGRSGAGKTSLAAELARTMRAAGRAPQILRVEDLYPGWGGLEAGSLGVVAALETGRYRVYDWGAERFGEAVRLRCAAPLIIEGCGALTGENLVAARAWARRARAMAGERSGLGDAGRVTGGGAGRGEVRGVWIDGDPEDRKRRALARDGESYAPFWDQWVAQEDAHYARTRPWELADHVLGL